MADYMTMLRRNSINFVHQSQVPYCILNVLGLYTLQFSQIQKFKRRYMKYGQDFQIHARLALLHSKYAYRNCVSSILIQKLELRHAGM